MAIAMHAPLHTGQSDLFGAAGVPGFANKPDVVDPNEEAALIAAIDASDLTPFRFQQWTGKRLTRSFGWSHDFETGRFAPTDPIPDWLDAVRTRAACFANVPASDLVQALLIRYDPGAGVGWHRDRPVFDQVIGISLGAQATMRFRRRDGVRFERFSVPLEPRALYHLRGDALLGWEHSIAAINAARWSITFRSLAG